MNVMFVLRNSNSWQVRKAISATLHKSCEGKRIKSISCWKTRNSNVSICNPLPSINGV